MGNFLDVLDNPRNESRGENVKINKTFSSADDRRRAADKKRSQSASSSWRPLGWIVGEIMDFPDLKQNQATSYLGVNWRVMHANREPNLSAVWLIAIRGYPALKLFAFHTYGPLTFHKLGVINRDSPARSCAACLVLARARRHTHIHTHAHTRTHSH